MPRFTWVAHQWRLRHQYIMAEVSVHYYCWIWHIHDERVMSQPSNLALIFLRSWFWNFWMLSSNTRLNVYINNNYCKKTKIVIKYFPQMTLSRIWTAFLTQELFLNVLPIILGVEWLYHVANLVDYDNFNTYSMLGVAPFGVLRHLRCRIWVLFGPKCHEQTPMVSYIKMTFSVWSKRLLGCQVLSRWFENNQQSIYMLRQLE